jgi:hypothetical protein
VPRFYPPTPKPRRYAWSAKLPLSILTDFEELAVYDCRVKPDRRDKASKARVNYLEFTEYPDRWEEIAGVFSREAVLKGSFNKYVESKRKQRGTAEVDDVFLKEIEGWREGWRGTSRSGTPTSPRARGVVAEWGACDSPRRLCPLATSEDGRESP